MPSIANQGDGGNATGPSDVYGAGRNISVLIGLGGTPDTRATLPPPGEQLGTLIQTTRDDSTFRTIADLAAFEAKTNPIHDVDSNPVGLLYDWGNYVVADAGGNTVVNVKPGGRMRTLAVLPDQTANVPGAPPGTTMEGTSSTHFRRHRGLRRRLLHQSADRLPLPARPGEHLPAR